MKNSQQEPGTVAASPAARSIRHFGGFVLAGTSALVVDIAVMTVLTAAFDWPPEISRVPAIIIAMTVSWWLNRTVTFNVNRAPTLKEYLGFAGASWISQSVNYGVFVLLLRTEPTLSPSAAIVGASLVAMLVSYVSFRYAVFRNPRSTAPTD